MLIYLFICSLGLHLQHMEVPRLGVESELQLPTTATATATGTPDPSCVCDLHHSSWQHWILNPLSKTRDHGYQSGSLTTEPRWELPHGYFNLRLYTKLSVPWLSQNFLLVNSVTLTEILGKMETGLLTH